MATVLLLVLLVAALGAAAWWWAGTDRSLGFVLTHAPRFLPAGMQLASTGARGSLREGGEVDSLHWQNADMAVDVTGLSIRWALRPLLDKQVRLGELHAREVRITPIGPPKEKKPGPPDPLQPIELPVQVDLPFRVDRLVWAGEPAAELTDLSGHYAYVEEHHRLEVASLAFRDGQYQAKVDLQGPAPMQLQAHVEAQVRAPLAEDRSLAVQARADLQGALAGRDARLSLNAVVDAPETGSGAPLSATVEAQLAPWQALPLIEAHAQLRNVDASRLMQGAPDTLLGGRIDVTPAPGAGQDLATTAWHLEADLQNARPGPWDQGRVPVEGLRATADYDGVGVQIPQAEIRAGGGRITASGDWRPAPQPWHIDARFDKLQPGRLHTALAGAPVSGSARAEQQGDDIVFDAKLDAQGGLGSSAVAGLRLQEALARGRFDLRTQALDLDTLRVVAAQARIEGKLGLQIPQKAGKGSLRAEIPGARLQIDGGIAPRSGDGKVLLNLDDGAALQRWVESLPGLGKAFGGVSVVGSARLQAAWNGGWEALQERLARIDKPAPRGAPEPRIDLSLVSPRLEVKLPAGVATPAGLATPATTTAPGSPASPGAPATPPAANAAAGDTRGTSSTASASSATASGAVPAATPPLLFTDLRLDLAGTLPNAKLQVQGALTRGTQRVELNIEGSGGLQQASQWRAEVDRLRVLVRDSARPGPWTLQTDQQVSATVRTGGGALAVETTAGGARLSGPVPGTVRLAWDPVSFVQRGSGAERSIRLRTKGRLLDLPLAWTKAFGGNEAMNEAGVSGDLVFDGEWDIAAADDLRARVRLQRKSGDLRVQAGEAALVRRIETRGTGTASERTMDASGEGLSTPAGLRAAAVQIDANDETVRATLDWDSERAGNIQATASTRVQRRGDGWQWAEDAPLEGRVRASLPNLGVWSILAPPGWRVAGTLEADATLGGNRAAPRWSGNLSADGLAVRALVEGLDLRDGRLRMRLAGDHVELTEFTLKGGRGSATRIPGQSGNISTGASEAASDGGTVSATGEMSWGPAAPGRSGIRLSVQAQLDRLRVLVRSDRQLTLSGNLQARLNEGQLTLRGALRTDRAVIILPDETAPSLGGDVVIHSAAKDREAQLAAEKRDRREQQQAARVQTAKPPDIDVSFDLGKDFAVQGRGITTRLEGKLDIRANDLSAPPRIYGEVSTVKGQYRAYGQQLDVESGLARFNGPFDNPALDILAIRPNITQRAGVQVTGTAQSPRVKLYSNPQLSDVETLSWVILGRASASSGAESQLLQQAALAVLGGFGKGGSGGGLASRFGLDEIGFKGPGSGGDLKESAVTLGKRLSKDFYVTYQRSLAGTLGSLFIFYDLTQRLTLRGQAGQQSGIDVIYTIKFD